MRRPEIQKLIDAVEARYGPVELYGSSEEEEYGTCFKLQNIAATFSVLTLEGTLAPDLFDIQIDGTPAGYYMCNREELPLNDFLKFIEQFKLPEKDWPQ